MTEMSKIIWDMWECFVLLLCRTLEEGVVARSLHYVPVAGA